MSKDDQSWLKTNFKILYICSFLPSPNSSWIPVLSGAPVELKPFLLEDPAKDQLHPARACHQESSSSSSTTTTTTTKLITLKSKSNFQYQETLARKPHTRRHNWREWKGNFEDHQNLVTRSGYVEWVWEKVQTKKNYRWGLSLPPNLWSSCSQILW